MSARILSRIGSIILLGSMLVGCQDDPVSADVPGVSDTTDAPFSHSFSATRLTGPPGYETILSATCVSRASLGGIGRFQVRSLTTDAVLHQVDEPESDSLSISIPVEVLHPNVIQMSCSSTLGHVHLEVIELDGFKPIIDPELLPAIDLFEDDWVEVTVDRTAFTYADSVSVVGREGLNVSVLSGHSSGDPVVFFQPRNPGTYPFVIEAHNAFGVTTWETDVDIKPLSDIDLDVVVANQSNRWWTTVEISDENGQVIHQTQVGLFSPSRSVELPSGIQRITIKAGHVEANHFVWQRSFDTSSGQDHDVSFSLVSMDHCRSAVRWAADAPERCHGLVGDLLFTAETGESGYLPYPPAPKITAITRNPETGEALSQAWIEQLRLVQSRMRSSSDIMMEIQEEAPGYSQASDGRLLFFSGSYAYPRTASEALNTPVRTEGQGSVLGSSVALDFQQPPPEVLELQATLMAGALGIRTGPDFSALSAIERIALLEQLIYRIRVYDATERSIPSGTSIEEVMGIP